MLTPMQRLEEQMVDACREVVDRLRPEYEQRYCGDIPADDPEREAKALKLLGETDLALALQPLPHIQKFHRFLPYFGGLDDVFEIGVGPGFLLRILHEALGIRVSGLDMKLYRRPLYTEMRQAMGIDDLVTEHFVTPGLPIPMPPGVQCIASFYAAFNKGWGVAEHEWFLQECGRQLVGARLVMLHFNALDPAVTDYLRQHATTPIANDDKFFIAGL